MARKVEDYEKGLSIKEDNLNQCLIDQAELYYHVADEAEAWVSTRDTLKYSIEKLDAELDLQIRKHAATTGEKVTETSIAKQITTHPEIVRLNEKLLDAKSELGRWSALRDAYEKRSKMLDLITSRELRLLHDLSMERGAAITRSNLIEAQSDKATIARRKKLSAE